jgi:hypothetical protein
MILPWLLSAVLKRINKLIQIQFKNSIGCHFFDKRSQCQLNVIIFFWQYWSLKMTYFQSNVVSFLFDFLLVFKNVTILIRSCHFFWLNVGVKKYLMIRFYDKTLSWALKMSMLCHIFFDLVFKNVTISDRRRVIYILTRRSSKHDMGELICVGRHT